MIEMKTKSVSSYSPQAVRALGIRWHVDYSHVWNSKEKPIRFWITYIRTSSIKVEGEFK